MQSDSTCTENMKHEKAGKISPLTSVGACMFQGAVTILEWDSRPKLKCMNVHVKCAFSFAFS